MHGVLKLVAAKRSRNDKIRLFQLKTTGKYVLVACRLLAKATQLSRLVVRKVTRNTTLSPRFTSIFVLCYAMTSRVADVVNDRPYAFIFNWIDDTHIHRCYFFMIHYRSPPAQAFSSRRRDFSTFNGHASNTGLLYETASFSVTWVAFTTCSFVKSLW